MYNYSLKLFGEQVSRWRKTSLALPPSCQSGRGSPRNLRSRLNPFEWRIHFGIILRPASPRLVSGREALRRTQTLEPTPGDSDSVGLGRTWEPVFVKVHVAEWPGPPHPPLTHSEKKMLH